MTATSDVPEAILERLEQELGLDRAAVEGLDRARLRHLVLKLDRPDRPGARSRHRRGAHRDADGTVHPRAVPRAHGVAGDDASTDRTQTDDTREANNDAPSAVARHGIVAPWESLGPANVGGRTRALLVDPVDPRRLLAGAVDGGVWRSDDRGATWEPVGDHLGNLAVCALARDPSNPETIWAGTGEGFDTHDAVRGAGIFVSRDGGFTWKHLEATATDDFHHVNRLAVSSDGAVLLAATSTGIQRSADGGASWGCVAAGRFGRVTFDPSSDSRALAAGNLGDGRLLRSVDGGVTWDPVEGPGTGADGDDRSDDGTAAPRLDVAFAAADPGVVYATVDTRPPQLWRSLDGGARFRRSGADGAFLGQQGWYAQVVWAGDPEDEDLVIVGGLDLWRSTDGGASLERISDWFTGRLHEDQHEVAGVVEDGRLRLFVGTDDGVWTTTDGRSGSLPGKAPGVASEGVVSEEAAWCSLARGYVASQLYAIAASPTGRVVVGAQDSGTLVRAPDASADAWTRMQRGDGGFVALDPPPDATADDAADEVPSSGPRDGDRDIVYGGYVHLQLYRNLHGGEALEETEFVTGQTWTGSGWSWKEEPWVLEDARTGRSLFAAPFLLDPRDPRRLVAGGASVWCTPDARAPLTDTTGPRWEVVREPVDDLVLDADGSVEEALVSALAVDPDRPGRLWVGYTSGRIEAGRIEAGRIETGSIDGATADARGWRRLDNGIAAGRTCTSLALAPGGGDGPEPTLWASFGGFQAGNLWRSADGGATWEDRSSGLPEAPVRWVTVHPADPAVIFAGTEVGLWVSGDAGRTWGRAEGGPARVAIYQLAWRGETLLVATHGRGAWALDLSEEAVSGTGADA